MRSFDPTLPSISFVLSQAPPRPRRLRRRPSKRIHRSKSSPNFTHIPLYPPQLESDFLMNTVDYRFHPPPCPPTRSSYALPRNIFNEDEVEIEIVVSSPTESSSSSTSSSTAATSVRRKAKVVAGFVQELFNTVRCKWRGRQSVRQTEARLSFDLCS